MASRTMFSTPREAVGYLLNNTGEDIQLEFYDAKNNHRFFYIKPVRDYSTYEQKMDFAEQTGLLPVPTQGVVFFEFTTCVTFQAATCQHKIVKYCPDQRCVLRFIDNMAKKVKHTRAIPLPLKFDFTLGALIEVRLELDEVDVVVLGEAKVRARIVGANVNTTEHSSKKTRTKNEQKARTRQGGGAGRGPQQHAKWAARRTSVHPRSTPGHHTRLRHCASVWHTCGISRRIRLLQGHPCSVEPAETNVATNASTGVARTQGDKSNLWVSCLLKTWPVESLTRATASGPSVPANCERRCPATDLLFPQ